MSAALAFIAAAAAVSGLTLIRPASSAGSGPGLVARIAKRVPARLRPPLDLGARVEAAGSPAGLGAGEVMAVKVLAAFGGLPLGAVFGSVVPGRLGILFVVSAPVVGFLAPDLYLARCVRDRIRAVRRELPGLLDLLRVAVDAGMAPWQALAAVARRSDALLAREWGGIAAQVELGVPLAVALERLQRRLPAAELRSFTAALTRAAVHGAPLSATLAAQGREARAARRRRLEEEAAKASPKIQLVVALLLVPSVLLIVAAALLSALLGGGARQLPY